MFLLTKFFNRLTASLSDLLSSKIPQKFKYTSSKQCVVKQVPKKFSPKNLELKGAKVIQSSVVDIGIATTTSPTTLTTQ